MATQLALPTPPKELSLASSNIDLFYVFYPALTFLIFFLGFNNSGVSGGVFLSWATFCPLR